MKNISLLTVLLLCAISSIAQEITRGPEIGEIYFMGPTATVLYDAIYRSTDFGETAVCVDSVSALNNTIEAITADKTIGGLYFVTMGEALYYSDIYGQFGSWEFKHSGIYKNITSGREIGEIYKSFIAHSDNFGENFTSHLCNGYFGTLKDVDIDVASDIGYCMSKKYNINDTLYFFHSFNNFDDIELVKKFDFHGLDNIDLSRENNEGNIFLCNQNSNKVFYSSNYGVNWELKNQLTCPNLPIVGITGGRQNGELYIAVEYLQMMGQRRHVYIYHSLDYGETFTVYHPVAIGLEPIYSNFIAEDTLVEPGDTVQFTDLSNDAETWEWDFDNDGTIDSYEQNPVHTYQDTGYYTVKLTITGYGGVIEDYGIRNGYIHVVDFTNTIEFETIKDEINIFPNPVNITLNLSISKNSNKILFFDLYNLSGELVRHFCFLNSKNQQNEISIPVIDLKSGIYFLKINTSDKTQIKKIIINH